MAPRLLLALLATCGVHSEAVALPLSIAVGQNAPAVDKFAASELKTLLQTVCPDLNFTVGVPSKGVAQWILGPDAALEVGVPSTMLEGLGNESFIVDTTGESPGVQGSAVLTGGIKSARGTLYAVNVMMDKIGMKFLAHDETYVPKCPASLPAVKFVKVSPSYEYRDDNQQQVSSQMSWGTRVGFNGPSSHQPPEQGNYIKYATPPGFVHTSYALFGLGPLQAPPAQYYTEHPEWFWPRGAVGAKTYGQLCWSNSSLVQFMISRVKDILRSQPDANIISVSQNDNFNRCMDPAEEKINDEEGSPMGALLRAVNTIAAAIVDEFPHVAVDTLAYQWSRPATKKTKPLPNVVIRLCSIECDFAHPLTHPNNAAFQSDMNNWAVMSNRTYIWDYITNFQNYFVPFPNWYVLGDNIKYFHKHGVLGIFEEGTYGTNGGDLVQLKDYVIARTLFNVSSDPLESIRDFLNGYFGEAAPFIQLYMDVMHGSVAETNYYMHESFSWNAPFLTPIVLLESARAFSLARAVAKDRFLVRVEQASMPTQFVALLRWEELQDFAKAKSIEWPFLATKKAQFDNFSKLYAAAGVTKLSEGGNNIAWLEHQLFPSIAQTIGSELVV